MDLRRLAGSLYRRLPGALRRRIGRGVVSIVVPVYNVEEYLAACLDSLLAQTHADLEIIVVLDGPTDGSAAIARRYAAADRRIRLREQPNQGLSAARNAGAAMARGEFLWFVDSDDEVAPAAAGAAVRSLRASGSDFAVFAYRRFDGDRTWNAMRWIRLAHDGPARTISAREEPSILVNAVAWSKVYRRAFFRRASLVFPVGARYEDQPVSARAYALAERVDVLPGAYYRWRERADGSSISQQGARIDDVAQRMAAARASLVQLERHGTPAMVAARAVQLLANDIPHSLQFLPGAPDAFYRELADGVAAVAARLPAGGWREVPAPAAAVEFLLARGEIDRARSVVATGVLAAERWPVRVDGAEVLLELPELPDADELPGEVLVLSARQRMPVVVAEELAWVGPGRLRLAGTATTRYDVSPDDAPSLALVPHRAAGKTHPLANAAGPGAFDVTIDVDGLGLAAGATYTVEVALTVAGRTDSTPLFRVAEPGATVRLGTSTSPRGVAVEFRRVDHLRLGLILTEGGDR